MNLNTHAEFPILRFAPDFRGPLGLEGHLGSVPVCCVFLGWEKPPELDHGVQVD